MSEQKEKTVQRYKEYRDPMGDCHCDVEEDGGGDFVLHYDYAKLEAECAALREALNECYKVMECNDPSNAHLARDALKAAGGVMGKVIKLKIPQRYWLCTGSMDIQHDKNCTEAKTGHPERCRFGTAKEHSRNARKGFIQCK